MHRVIVTLVAVIAALAIAAVLAVVAGILIDTYGGPIKLSPDQSAFADRGAAKFAKAASGVAEEKRRWPDKALTGSRASWV